MFLISFANILPRRASMTAFLVLVVAHLEWPLIDVPFSLRRTASILPTAAGPPAPVRPQARPAAVPTVPAVPAGCCSGVALLRPDRSKATPLRPRTSPAAAHFRRSA